MTEEPAQSLEEWSARLSAALNLPTEFSLDIELVLGLARDAAHGVARPAAPLTTFLVGYAAAIGDGSPETVERLAAVASRLASEPLA